MKKIILLIGAFLVFLLIACQFSVLTGINDSYTFNVGESITFSPTLTNSKDEVVFEIEIIEGEDLISLEKLTIIALFEGTIKLRIYVVEKEFSKEFNVIILNPLKITGNNIVVVDNSITLISNKTGVTWTSLDESIATVVDGLVTGKSVGNVTITASLNDETYDFELEVRDLELEIIARTNKVNVGKTLQITVNKTGVSWNTSNPSIATVVDGLVTGVSIGEVTISASIGEESKSVIINIEKADDLQIYGLQYVIVGDTITLTTDEPNVIWSSSDENIARVEQGIVTGLSYGKVTITVSLGEVSAYLEVFVDIEELVISGANAMLVNTSLELESNHFANWYSSNETVATVVDGKVTATKVGEVVITAIIGVHEATHTILIIDKQLEIKASALVVAVGENIQITVTDALDVNNLGVAFSTSNSNIARVSSTGRVTGQSLGEVTITATSRINQAIITIKIEVVPLVPTALFVINPPGGPFLTDTQTTFLLNSMPTNADKTVIWRSTDDRIAEVVEGLLIIHTIGKVTITAISVHDSKIQTSFELTINYDAFKLVDDIMRSNIIAKDIWTNANDASRVVVPGNTHRATSSVSNYYFDVLPTITKDLKNPSATPNMAILGYVVVHDTGNNNQGSTARANHNWGKGPDSGVSWHYTVGNDGIFQMLEENVRGAHAGDSGAFNLNGIDTGVSANGSRKQPKITVNWDAKRFVINGVLSQVAIPSSATSSYRLPTLGYYTTVGANGNYYIGNTHWSSTYSTIGNSGGNQSGIGIESCVNRESDLFLTWHYLAKLVADILIRNSLGFDRVTQHNNHSGKDCPMTLRAAGLWDMFMDMVRAEYYMRTAFYDKGYSISLESSAPTIVNSTGRVISRPSVDTNVNVKLTIISPNGDQTQKIYTYAIPKA